MRMCPELGMSLGQLRIESQCPRDRRKRLRKNIVRHAATKKQRKTA